MDTVLWILVAVVLSSFGGFTAGMCYLIYLMFRYPDAFLDTLNRWKREHEDEG